MAKLHVVIAVGVDGGRHFAPQHAGFHDIGLLNGSHPVLPLAGHLEGQPADAVDFRRGVNLRVDGALFTVP